jgi:SAM-dependent methyltransferase
VSSSGDWFENDHLWDVMQNFIFNENILEAAPGEVELMINLLGLEPGSAVLDLCCGPGRHSLELARRGYAVTGVDRTEKYIEDAREGAAKEKLNTEFILADMLSFCRPDSFDTIINMYTAFGYFEDYKDECQVVSNMYQSLKPGGRLLMDMAGKEWIAKVYQKRDWREKDGVFVLEERIPVNNWRYLDNRWIVIKDGKKEEFMFRLRTYSAVELTDLLKSQGFDNVEIFSDLEGAPYAEKVKRLVAVAVK